MGAKDEVLELFRQGLDPMQISEQRGTTVQTTIGYLHQLVGRGDLRPSDVLFSIPRDRREAVARQLDDRRRPAEQRLTPIKEALESQGMAVTWDELRVVIAFHHPDAPWGDMYEDIRSIECELHRLLRRLLEEHHGVDEAGWWRQGVPADIRVECQRRREEDPAPAPEPWCYTDLKHLARIVDRRWSLIASQLPASAGNKREVLADLARLNLIRNQVMHPVRGEQPDQDDFEFVRALRIRLGFWAGVAPPGQAAALPGSPGAAS